MSTSSRFSPLSLVLFGGAIMGLALGIRHAQGLFLVALAPAFDGNRADFALALAVQNLVWGLTQPLAGMLADRFGSRRLIAAGCLLYALGLVAMARATTGFELVLGAGVVLGVALSCTAFGAVYGALSRMLVPGRRSWGLGLAGAVGGLGQFLAIPVTQDAIGTVGAQGALLMLAGAMALLCVCALPLDDRRADAAPAGHPQALAPVLRAAFRHRGMWMLGLGFLACGFQLAFIATHLPAYLLDRGFGAREAVVALSLVAMANVAGTYVCGLLGARLRKPHLLSVIYLIRSAVIALFVLAPLGEGTLYLFSLAMGLLWLGTVPLTTGIVSQVFGTRYLATLFGFVFLGHQVGSFAGVWLGGAVFDATGSYGLVWLCAVAVGLFAAVIHWPISDAPLAAPRPAHAA
ncbi:MFS transporter [Massilia niastensis]|uniref:MFS transporter n=1 Tax=Massilia niastensis TaxID=544911 RepID=UPI000368E83D|nr:MFS transporter [Massilia niastensis]